MRINTLTARREMTSETGERLRLYYYLVQDSETEKVRETAYGVGVVKRTGSGEEEREWIPGISHSREEAERLLAWLARGCVTPVSAVACVDDWMGM